MVELEKVLLGKGTGFEISQTMFVARAVVRRIQIRVVAVAANTAVEGNGRSVVSRAAQCNPVDAATLAERLVEGEAVRIPLVWDKDYTEGGVSDDGLSRTRVDEEYQVAYTGLDVRSRHTWAEVDMETEDRDTEIEEENVSVSGQGRETGLVEDWAASAASTSGATGHPSVAGPDQEGSEVALAEFAGTVVSVADIVVVAIHIVDLVAGGTKRMEVVERAKVVVAVVDFATIDEKTANEAVVMSAELLVAEIVENVGKYKGEGQVLQGCLEHSALKRSRQTAAENLDFR